VCIIQWVLKVLLRVRQPTSRPFSRQRRVKRSRGRCALPRVSTNRLGDVMRQCSRLHWYSMLSSVNCRSVSQTATRPTSHTHTHTHTHIHIQANKRLPYRLPTGKTASLPAISTPVLILLTLTVPSLLPLLPSVPLSWTCTVVGLWGRAWRA